MTEPEPRIGELRLAADPGAWRAVGFEIEDEATRIGGTGIAFEAAVPGGISGWSLSGVGSDAWDGLPTELTDPIPLGSPPEHPNGAFAIDHLVVFTPELERTIAAFEANGVGCRRVREVGPPDQRLRQAFFRFGEVISEVVQVPRDQAGPEGAARFWGLTVTVADLEGAVADLGPERCGSIRDAVQPGRRIATVRREAALGLPVALISPDPARSGG